MAVSEFFTDEELVAQIRLQFGYDEQWDMDFREVFSHITDRGGDLYLEFRGKKLIIDKITGVITDITNGGEE